MLFDEPTSALDPEMINEVLDVMVALAIEGMTMMVVTHEMGFAARSPIAWCLMDKGEIVEDAPTADFFGKPRSSARSCSCRRSCSTSAAGILAEQSHPKKRNDFNGAGA